MTWKWVLAARDHSSLIRLKAYGLPSLLNAVILQWPQGIAVSWQRLCPKRRELRYLITKLRVFCSLVAATKNGPSAPAEAVGRDDTYKGVSNTRAERPMSDYLKAVQERVVIYDGAMGTAIQAYNLPLDEFWGKDGYNDILVLSRPDIVKEIHAKYFEAGADVVETNTFNSSPMDMAEYDMLSQVREINAAAARLAREVASGYSSKGRKRFVAGSMGPTRKLPSLGNISFDEMAAGYTEQAIGLIEGGVDVLLLETCQDILQAKAGLVGIFDALKKTGKNVPVQVQVTLRKVARCCWAPRSARHSLRWRFST